jgi:hypothetical protein
MNYRLASILPSEAANSAGTKTIDINVADPISRFVIQIKGLNSADAPVAHPAKMISKIELVDGSDVLFSLSGVEAQALNFYDQGKVPHTVLNYLNDVYAIATFHIDFGRFLYDPVLAFDPKKFTNPQLKITHDLTKGGSTPDAATLSVYAHLFDEKAITPVGFLMSKEQYGYTLVQSAKEHIDLATDYPYRKILLQSMSATLQPWQQYNQVKLSQDNDKKVVINDEKTSDLLKLFRLHPALTETIYAKTKNGTQVIHCASSYERIQSVIGVGAELDGCYIVDTYGGAISVADGAAASIMMIVNGFVPHSAFCLPFGDQKDQADWFDVSGIGSLRLTLTAGSSAVGTCEVISQQIRGY